MEMDNDNFVSHVRESADILTFNIMAFRSNFIDLLTEASS